MIYRTGREYLEAKNRRVALFGMSGLGKTWVSNMLRRTPAREAGWFHYSVDYRIGTHYMGEHIADNFKREAMKVPLLRELLLTDSVYIASNITFSNLAPLSTYLGKPGDPARGGLALPEYMKRQEQHRKAEIAATLETTRFIGRAEEIYGYPHFVCDTSGSICEVVDPFAPRDAVLDRLTKHLLLVWIEGSDAHAEELARRFDRAPKPMYYQPDFLRAAWRKYHEQHGIAEGSCDPDHFVRWIYARALAHRRPRYRAMAGRGVTVGADEIAAIATPEDFDALIARAIDRRIAKT